MVIGKDGLLGGSIYTLDAIIAGRVRGAVFAESRLELQATSDISGEIRARRMRVEEEAVVRGQVAVGEGGVERGAVLGGVGLVRRRRGG